MTPFFAGQSLGRRESQEDAFRVERQNDSDPSSDVLLLLADGMGGHEGGEVASAVALDAFLDDFLRRSEIPRPRERLSAALRRANEAIAARVALSPELAGMGCTLIGCLKLAERLVWISVGDSILYLYRGGKLRRLNADHSVYGAMRELVAEGKLSQAEAERHPRRNALRSAVVGSDMPLVDLNQLALEAGDIVLLASDGLDTLGEDAIERMLGDLAEAEPEQIGAALLAAVERCDRPNQDNTTVIVFRHRPAAAGTADGVSKWVLPPSPAAARASPQTGTVLVRSAVVAGGLLLAAGAIAFVMTSGPEPAADASQAEQAGTTAPREMEIPNAGGGSPEEDGPVEPVEAAAGQAQPVEESGQDATGSEPEAEDAGPEEGVSETLADPASETAPEQGEAASSGPDRDRTEPAGDPEQIPAPEARPADEPRAEDQPNAPAPDLAATDPGSEASPDEDGAAGGKVPEAAEPAAEGPAAPPPE